MTFEDLQQFITVYEAKSVSSAAATLNMSQSALSKRLKAMQEELGTKLILTANRQHLTITETGERFYRFAQRETATYEQLKSEIRSYEALHRGTLRLDMIPIASQYGLTVALKSFIKHYPDINVQLTEQPGDAVLTRLQRGEIDLGILRDMQTQQLEPAQYVCQTIATDELKVVMAHDHPLAQRQSVNVRDLAGYDVVLLGAGSGVYELVTARYHEAELIPNIRLTTMHAETLLSLIQTNNWVTFLFDKTAQAFIDDRFATCGFDEPVVSQLQVAYRKNQLSRVAAQFVTEALGL
ncbi:LysR family transcriptional regulator [Secundilactobacillus similis]|uniref:Transcriptional regulator n=1 Tax=Secundilactobacillus similis DSM 23365 = JCM 2765 TaxID=1423804 RepID=A0A0R2FDX9_9LACO|nr:LysR family transcriptional regulator [Secundilactobacillus similis]KRN26817.1 transcriptional regulator [Secundilactobacillus similis DSM 23365 = JCM 2765]